MNAPATLAAPSRDLTRLTGFLDAVDTLLSAPHDEASVLAESARLLAGLVRHDDWLPAAYAVPDPQYYRQYLLHRDPAARFSLVSFVWGPGQATPVHDHRVWGVVGVLRGAELVEDFHRDADGTLRRAGDLRTLAAGDVESFSPATGDIHRVANAYDDRVSVSIHLYGADIGAVQRATYDRDGRAKPFVSGYADLPALVA
jgi:predicted metal-dependent enzyme (double-stranded beta helix superfamily)